LLLVEASLTLALLLLLLMAILGRQAGLVGQQEVLHLGAAMLIIGVVSWQIGEHYKEERKIHNEKKLLDFKTFEYYNTSDEETDEDPNVQPSRGEGRDRNTNDGLITGGTIRPDNPSVDVDAVDSQ